MMKLSWPLAHAVATMAFAWHTASASVGPDPSDATVLVADVADGQTETLTLKATPLPVFGGGLWPSFNIS